MDPLTATAAAVSIVCGIVGAVNSAQTMHERRKRKKEAAAAALGTPLSSDSVASLDAGRPMDAFGFSVRMNYLLSRLGRQLLDDKAQREVFRLRAPLQNITKELARLGSNRRYRDVERLEKVLVQVGELKDNIEEALVQFASRITATQGLSKPSPGPLRVESHLDFCYGAIRCQTANSDARGIAQEGTHREPNQWGFVCRHCSLEVGDYSAVRFLRNGKAVVHSEMLAACHVTACASLSDRRAFYKCPACYGNRQDVNFSSASALEKHMEFHPDYHFVTSSVAETAIIECTEKNMSTYVLDPSDDTRRLMDEEDGWPDAQANTSPPDSPEATSSQSRAHTPTVPTGPVPPPRASRPPPLTSTTTATKTATKRATTPSPVSPVTPAASPAIPDIPRPAPAPPSIPTVRRSTPPPVPAAPRSPPPPIPRKGIQQQQQQQQQQPQYPPPTELPSSAHEYRPHPAELPTPAPARPFELSAHPDTRNNPPASPAPTFYSAGSFYPATTATTAAVPTPPGSAGLHHPPSHARHPTPPTSAGLHQPPSYAHHSGQNNNPSLASTGRSRREERVLLQPQPQPQYPPPPPATATAQNNHMGQQQYHQPAAAVAQNSSSTGQSGAAFPGPRAYKSPWDDGFDAGFGREGGGRG